MKSRRNRFILSFALVIVVSIAASPVLAHANLVRSEPAADSASPVAPTSVRLWFSEQVEPRFTTISVLNSSGVAVDKGDSQQLPGDAQAMQVSVPELPRGLYTVVWRALSAVDGHVTNGSFSFTVGEQSLSEGASGLIIAQVDRAIAASTFPPIQDVVIRWLNILFLALLIGSFTFPLFVLAPAIRHVPVDKVRTAWQAWSRRWLAMSRSVFVLYAVMTILVLLMQAFNAGSGFDSIVTVLTSTRFGFVWLLRVAIVIALGVVLFRATWNGDAFVKSNHGLVIATLLSIGLAITQSANSHAAAVSDPPILPFFVDLVHLLGTAIWVGGLAQLLLTLPAFLRALDPTQRVRQLAALISRFSLVAFLTVGVIIATGAFSSIVQVGSIDAFFATLYGISLFAKFGLIVPLLALGALNLIVARPALTKRIAQHADKIIARFNISIALEVIFATAVLFVIGIMTSVAPARSVYDPTSKLWLESRSVDDINITLAISPGVVGQNDFDVFVRDGAGKPVSGATVVRLLGTMREMDMGTQELTAKSQGNGHYTLRADVLSMVGNWQIETLVRREGRDDARTPFAIAPQAQSSTPAPPLILSSAPAQAGLLLTLIAFAIGTASVLLLKPHRSRWVSLIGALMVASIGLLVVNQAVAETQLSVSTVVPVAPEFARLTRSPIHPTADQLAAGEQIYSHNCATCHGVGGKGDGPAAVNLNPRPVDLTVHTRQHTEGELYWWVTNGISGTAMPAWNDRLSDLQRWQVVQFIRTLGGNPTPTTAQ